jgi:hypothetical protein
MRYLLEHDIEVAPLNQVGCSLGRVIPYEPLPYRLEVFRYACNPILKRRNTNISKIPRNTKFHRPLVEVLFKPSVVKAGYPDCHYVVRTRGNCTILYLPDTSEHKQNLNRSKPPIIFPESNLQVIRQLREEAVRIFEMIEGFWKNHKLQLVDTRFEFAFSENGRISLITDFRASTRKIP